MAEFISCTVVNPVLATEDFSNFSDLAMLQRGYGTFSEKLIEYAGRVCYRSTQRMGTAPNFIQARMKEGHLDIVEHAWVTIRAGAEFDPWWRNRNKYLTVTNDGSGWLVSGNLRAWHDLFAGGYGIYDALPVVRAVAPKVFESFPGDPATYTLNLVTPYVTEELNPRQLGPMRVSLLGWSSIGDFIDDEHGSATFLFEGISRACTHQLVRHRLASFSQESQRYVDLAKGEWQPIVPPAIAANPEAMEELADFWGIVEQKYARLRDLGIRKEDARFLLPNAAETRIVVSMPVAGWKHFFALRALDKVAQWEIRAMGQMALRMLYAAMPLAFAEQMLDLLKFEGVS